MKRRIAPPLKAPLKTNVLLFSPRQTGKSSFLKSLPQVDLYLNLHEADTFRKLSFQKNIIEKLLTPDIKIVALDNVDRLPSMLEQVRELNKRGVHFIVSSSQKIELPCESLSLLPLCSEELGVDFNLSQILNFGSLPSVFESEHKDVLLSDYVGILFQEDLIRSGKIRKIENFSRFLNVAAEQNGQFINYENIAKLCEAPARTVREYYKLLIDLRLGYEVQGTREFSGAPRTRFYFFDIGVSNALKNDFNAESDFEKTEAALKQLVLLELMAFKNYRDSKLKIEFWCDYQGNEIDLLINNSIAIDVRATKSVNSHHFRRLNKFATKAVPKKSFLISQDPQGLTISAFLNDLWRGKIV